MKSVLKNSFIFQLIKKKSKTVFFLFFPLFLKWSAYVIFLMWNSEVCARQQKTIPNEVFGPRWLERHGICGSEICPRIYARNEYENISNGNATFIYGLICRGCIKKPAKSHRGCVLKHRHCVYLQYCNKSIRGVKRES